MNTKSPRSILPFVCAADMVAAVLLAGTVSTAFAAASLTPVGDLPGGSFYSEAYGVSGDGSVVVGRSGSASGPEAFRWTQAGGMQGLGNLPGGINSVGNVANDVNYDGSVVIGDSVVGDGVTASRQQAFRWTSGGGMVGLGNLPGGVFNNSVARGVSGDGSVVVGGSDSDSGAQAFRWTSDGGMMGLGRLHGRLNGFSVANGVSGDGSVVVGSDFVDYGVEDAEAFLWTSGGGMVGLGHLPGGTSFSHAFDVSGDGSVIVGISGSEAFRWTSDGGMMGLGKLPGGINSAAKGVSGDGSIVVGSSNLNPGFSAFYWTAEDGIRELWDLLLSHGVDPAADGWTGLSTAQGISADGNTIVGYGTRNGNTEAFVAVIPIVPEPAGDFNHDGTVDAADYVVWRDGLGGAYDETHYTEWRQNFGATAAGAAAVARSASLPAVPEPATTLYLLFGIAGLGMAGPATIIRRRALTASDGSSRRRRVGRRGVATSRLMQPCYCGELTETSGRWIRRQARFLTGRASHAALGLRAAAMLASYRRPPERSNPMRQLKLFRWAAVLMLTIALAPGAASAQEDGTITISGTFRPIWLDGTVGPDLAEVYANGNDHAWTLTLYGTTQSHSTYSTWFGYLRRATEIHATSFDLEFFGPDAATLNGIVSEHIAGGDVSVYLENAYSSGFGDDFAVWDVSVFGPDVEFWTGELSNGWNTLFPSDADGYPVVGPAPFSIWAEDNILVDNRPGNDGWMGSGDSLVTIGGSVGEPDPGEPVVLAVADASVLEGNRGSSKVTVPVTLSSGSSQAITVSYRTVDGTATAKADYTATSGTLTFQPGETSRTISIAIKGDRKWEANETFSVELSNAVGATIADGFATVTILNDDK